MTRAFAVYVSTPGAELAFEQVLALRFDAPDGSRGVLAGHEPAWVVVEAGVVKLALATDGPPRTCYVAAERGLLEVSPREVRLVTAWAEAGEDLGLLGERLVARGRRRRELDAEARVQLERHELAARRALSRLQREVHR